MVTKIMKYTARELGRNRVASEYYCLHSDQKPNDAANADTLYIMDWNELTDKEKAAAGARCWIYDGENARWLPM